MWCGLYGSSVEDAPTAGAYGRCEYQQDDSPEQCSVENLDDAKNRQHNCDDPKNGSHNVSPYPVELTSE